MSELRLKKGEERRIRNGHPWVFSNEVNTTLTPLRSFQPGEQVAVLAHNGESLGVGYVNPHSLIVARLFSPRQEDRITVDFLCDRLQTALSLRQQLFAKPFYRLVFSEADGLPGLIVDRFDNDLVVQINTAGMDQHQGAIATALRTVIPTTSSIFLRNDSPIRQMEGLELYNKPLHGQPPEIGRVEENGVQFAFPLTTGQKTGWFYDHRQNRARLQAYVANKSVLDVFSYLGGFGVQAAVFGARQVDCIETSASACDFINKNAQANQVADKVTTLCVDAFDGMKELVQAGKKYDVIILDPPAFVKKAKDHKEGLAAYQRINELALRLLSLQGILFSCSCSMHVATEELMQVLQRASYRTQTTLQLLERGHQGPDHPIHLAIPETDYLKALVLRAINN